MWAANFTANFTGCDNETRRLINYLMHEKVNSDMAGDATWILTSAFIIFTMQSGFGLVEAGAVSPKNETNIMVKNAVDVILGALGYWICGFAFSFGDDPKYSNGFTGFGHFFTDIESKEHDNHDGQLFARYLFQLSFATTATTIVSGAMAERTNLKAYMFFSFVNFFSYVFPAHWVWADNGVFAKLGVVDIAGCGPVHLVGGVSAFVASLILKPRMGVFVDGKKINKPMASPTNVILGTFMLWWGWIGFNCGSTFGVSGGKWKLATKAAVTTVNAAAGGGLWALFYCYFLTKKFKKKLDIGTLSEAILGGLVSITGICALCNPWEAILIGAAGGVITVYGAVLMEKLQVDDPVNSVPVHCFCGLWGMLVCGLFGEHDTLENVTMYAGVTKGGPWKYFGYQALAAVTIMAWGAATSAIELFAANLIFGLRISEEEEIQGCDFCEHGILQFESDEEEREDQNTRVNEEEGKKFQSINISTENKQEGVERVVTNRNPFRVREVDNPIFFKQGNTSSCFNETSYYNAPGWERENHGFIPTDPIFTIGAQRPQSSQSVDIKDISAVTTPSVLLRNEHELDDITTKRKKRRRKRPGQRPVCILL